MLHALKKHAPAIRRAPATLGLAPRAAREQVHHILHGPRPQTKLTIGPPGDAYEQEADRVADQVMRMPDVRGSDRQIQRMCKECQEEEQESVRRTSEPAPAPASTAERP